MQHNPFIYYYTVALPVPLLVAITYIITPFILIPVACYNKVRLASSCYHNITRAMFNLDNSRVAANQQVFYTLQTLSISSQILPCILASVANNNQSYKIMTKRYSLALSYYLKMAGCQYYKREDSLVVNETQSILKKKKY